MNRITPRSFHALAGCTLAILLRGFCAEAAAPADFPARPIRLIAPFPPGSPPDVVGRVFAERMTTALGQTVIVDNRPGATGTIGTNIVAKAAPDGHTIGMIALPVVVAPLLLHKTPYDTLKDLAPVKVLAWSTNILVVPAAAPYKSPADIVAAAKVKPGQVTYASGGSGTPSHLAAALLGTQTGATMRHVPYRGAVEGVSGILTGEVDLMFAATTAVAAHIQSGRLRPLATTEPQRLSGYPAVPTVTELGYGGVDVRDFQGIVAPAGTPQRIIARIADELEKIKAHPPVRQRLESLGMVPAGPDGPEAFSTLIGATVAKWGKIIGEGSIRMD